VLLYVGEARGGCSVDTLRRNTPLSLSSRRVAAARYNADASFFDLLEARWRVKRVLRLAPFRGGHEKLYVCKRRSHPFK